MIAASRRRVLHGALAALGGAMLRANVVQAAADPRTIELVARRFVYEPGEIVVPAGERIVLAVRAVDFVHGLNIPDLGLRADLVPGRIVRIELPPLKAGVVDFLCDNFCGDGHEEMHGRLIVRG